MNRRINPLTSTHGVSRAPQPPLASREDVQRWFDGEPGKWLARQERDFMDDVLFQLFGYFLVQVGGLGSIDLIRNSRVLHRCVVDVEHSNSAARYQRIHGRPASLPFESDSVDVLVMPHVLEFERRPHEALREASRVLVPEGHLVISTFNPLSLYGLWQVARRRRNGVPWCGQFLSQGRVRDWLALLGLESVRTCPLGFGPPTRNARLHRRLQRADATLAHLAPIFSGVFVIVARKRVSNAPPIRAKRQYRRLMDVAIAQPSARVADLD